MRSELVWPVTVAAAVAVLLPVNLLARSDWEPTTFIAVGEDARLQRDYVEARFAQVWLRDQLGHDGRFFFIQANDPLLLNPSDHAAFLDRPAYRSQRMLYPLLVGLGGLLPVDLIPWGMAVVSGLSIVAGTLAVCLLALRRRRTAWLGVAFAFNIGVLVEFDVGGAGVLAAALMFWALLCYVGGRMRWAAVLLGFAVLAREVYLLVPAGLVVWELVRGRPVNWRLALPAVGAAALWGLYVRTRLGFGSGGSEVQELTAVPFRGVAESMRSNADDPLTLVLGVVFLLIFLRFAWLASTSRDPLAWATVGFAILPAFLTAQVWREYFDIARAALPVFTAYPLVLAQRLGGSDPGGPG